MSRYPECALLLAATLLFSVSLRAADLLDIYRDSLQNDPVFLAAEYQHLASVEARPQARAALLPQVSLGGNIARTDADDDGLGNYQSNGIDLTVVQSLYRRSNYVLLSQADLQIEQAQVNYTAARQALLLRAAERYFAILAAGDNLEFARSEKNAIERQLEQAERRYEVGLIAITDVKEAQASFDLALAQEIAADNQLAAAREALRVLTGSAAPAIRALDEDSPLQAPTPADSEDWVAIADENSLVLHSARLDVEIARKSIALERAARLPNTELIGSYSNANSDGLSGDSEVTQIRVQFSVPLYTGGSINSRVRQAHAGFELARQQQNSEQRNAEQQTRDAYRNVLADISRVKALKQALASTQSGAEATQAGFDVGTRTAVDVLIALRQTYNAQANYASARYEFILDTLRLKQAAGVLSLTDLEEVNGWLLR